MWPFLQFLLHQQGWAVAGFFAGKSWMFQTIPVADPTFSSCHTCLTSSTVNYMDARIHLSSVRLPVGFRKPPVGTAPGVILVSRGIVILQTDSVSADAHFLHSFSRLILGLAFLSCFPVMFFMLGLSESIRNSACRRLKILSEQRNRRSQPYCHSASCTGIYFTLH